MRRITALMAGVAVMVAVTAVGLPTAVNQAQADAPCTGGSHWHHHFPKFHDDYGHDHGTYSTADTSIAGTTSHQHDGYPIHDAREEHVRQRS